MDNQILTKILSIIILIIQPLSPHYTKVSMRFTICTNQIRTMEKENIQIYKQCSKVSSKILGKRVIRVKSKVIITNNKVTTWSEP